MTKNMNYIFTILVILSIFGLHFLASVYPYIALSCYLVWAGICLWSVELTHKENGGETKKLLDKSVKISNDLLEELSKSQKYISYLEILSASLLEKVKPSMPDKTTSEIIDEILKESPVLKGILNVDTESNNK